jgi:hypothetical protein
LTFGFPQQACNQHLHLLLRRQKVLALILAFIFAGGFFFAGSREAHAAGHDGGQQSSQATQPHESAPASPQSVPAAAPTTVQTASVESPPAAAAQQAPVSQTPVVTQSAPPPVSSAPVAADPAPAGNTANIASPATTVQPPPTPVSIPIGSAPTVNSAPPPILTTQDSSKPVAQNPGPPATAGSPGEAPQTEPAPKGPTTGSADHYTPQASANPTPQPVSKTSRQPGPAPQTPPRPVSADNPSPAVTSPLANQPVQQPAKVATSNEAVVPLLLSRVGGDAVAKTINPLRDVAPSFLLSHVDTKKGTEGWISAAPDTSGSLPSPLVLLGNVGDSAVGLLQGVAYSVLEVPTNMPPLQWAADSYKGMVGTPSVDVPLFSRGAQTTAFPGSSPVTVESASHDPPEPSSPVSLPEESNVPFSLSSSSHLNSGGGGSASLLLLAGALASVLFLLERDGRLSWVSLQLLKPSSPLIPVLERPG